MPVEGSLTIQNTSGTSGRRPKYGKGGAARKAIEVSTTERLGRRYPPRLGSECGKISGERLESQAALSGRNKTVEGEGLSCQRDRYKRALSRRTRRTKVDEEKA